MKLKTKNMLLTLKIDFKNEIFKERILFISIYIISHSLIFLISNAIYWDDWTLIDKEESIKNIFTPIKVELYRKLSGSIWIATCKGGLKVDKVTI